MIRGTATPFIIVADLRTGSTLLSSSLAMHPQVRCYGELFHSHDLQDNEIDGFDRRGASAAAVLRRATRSNGARAVGFKAMVFLPLEPARMWADAWERMRELPGLHVIFLTRLDRLAQYASLQIASHTGIYHSDDNDRLYQGQNRPTISIDRAAFRTWLRQQNALMYERRQTLRGLPSLDITYEALTSEWESTTTRVQEFLQVDVHSLEAQKQKQEPRSLAEIIENYDEFQAEATADDAAHFTKAAD